MPAQIQAVACIAQAHRQGNQYPSSLDEARCGTAILKSAALAHATLHEIVTDPERRAAKWEEEGGPTLQQRHIPRTPHDDAEPASCPH